MVDPKKRNFLAYRGATLFKPNLKEMREGLKIEVDARHPDQVEAAVEVLRQQLELEGVLLTLSERGVYLAYAGNKVHLPAVERIIADVSGAGDTVVSVAALALAVGLPPARIAALANLAGGIVCQYVGVVPINARELQAEAQRLAN